jgi:hypothetical protein
VLGGRAVRATVPAAGGEPAVHRSDGRWKYGGALNNLKRQALSGDPAATSVYGDFTRLNPTDIEAWKLIQASVDLQCGGSWSNVQAMRSTLDA